MRIVMPAVLSPSGISKATREYFKLIRWIGLPVATMLGLDEQLPLLEKGVTADMISVSGPIPEGETFIQLYVGLPNNMGMMPRSAAVVGIFFFEGMQLSSTQMGPVASVKVMGAPSSFCHTGLLKSGISPNRIRKIPIPLDEAIWNPSVSAIFPNEGRFRFLFMNSIYERKGLDVLLRAYWQAFSKRDMVELVVKSYRENDRPIHATRYIEAIAAKYGHRLTFLVGFDVQHLLREGSPQQVRAEVRYLVDTFDRPAGGMCLAAGNGIVAGTPFDNIDAFLDEAVCYGAKHRGTRRG